MRPIKIHLTHELHLPFFSLVFFLLHLLYQTILVFFLSLAFLFLKKRNQILQYKYSARQTLLEKRYLINLIKKDFEIKDITIPFTVNLFSSSYSNASTQRILSLAVTLNWLSVLTSKKVERRKIEMLSSVI